jgi:hypothetical protein
MKSFSGSFPKKRKGGDWLMEHETLPLAENLKRESHRICSLILNSDLPWIDIAIQINEMREMCLEQAPEKAELFDAVYLSRFTRLWDQWRAP